MTTIRVDKSNCVGSGCCLVTAPDAFRLDDDELAEPTPAAAALPLDVANRIAANCPGRAITVIG